MSSHPSPRVSVVVNTLNEELRLPYALRSVRRWVDEIVVVDMHSDDRTVEVARSFGATVHLHDRVGYADPARAFALAQATGDWILILDADELVPEPLARRLLRIATDDLADAVRIPMVNYLLGAALRGTGWRPEKDNHLRFFRRGSVEATGEIHNYLHPVPGARVVDVEPRDGLCLVHHNYTDVAQFIEKLNRYTEIEARALVAAGRSVSQPRALLSAVREFVRHYVKQRGFRDGWRGFYLAWLMAGYRIATAAKVAQLRHGGTREEIEASYRSVAEDVLRAHELQEDPRVPRAPRDAPVASSAAPAVPREGGR